MLERSRLNKLSVISLLSTAMLAIFAESLSAQVVMSDPSLNFTVTFPAGFEVSPRPYEAGLIFRYGKPTPIPGEAPIYVVFTPQFNELPPRLLRPDEIPAEFKDGHSVIQWQGEDVDLIEYASRENKEEGEGEWELINYRVTLPLEGKALLVLVSGPAAAKQEVRTAFDGILAGLVGNSSRARLKNTSSSNRLKLIIIFVIGLLYLPIATFGAYRTPIGLFLGLGVVITIVAFLIDPGILVDPAQVEPTFAEEAVKFAIYLVRAIGVVTAVGGIVGIVLKFVLKRKPQSPQPKAFQPLKR